MLYFVPALASTSMTCSVYFNVTVFLDVKKSVVNNLNNQVGSSLIGVLLIWRLKLKSSGRLI